jgi:LPXTG-motif cell wall-anchored protein
VADVPSPAPSGTGHAARLPSTGFDGILVAAAGTALTVAGWLLLLAGSRRLRR